jgi:hypothetical protein
LNNLFSGLTFAGVVIALDLQMEEFALEREETRCGRNSRRP